jgi:hypothetical protein
MDYREVAGILNLSGDLNIWQENWDLSQSGYPGGDIFFLRQEYLAGMNKLLNLPGEAMAGICEAADIIRNDEALSRLAWHCHYILFKLPDYKKEDVDKWPSLDSCSRKVSDMFLAIITISGIPQMQELYDKMNIPHNVLIDTLDYIRVWMEDFRRRRGRWGYSNFTWFIYHQMKGYLFRLGRLEYEPAGFKGKIKVYRNKGDGKVIALSEPGIEFRSDGQVNGTNDIFDVKGFWVSELVENGDKITGNPIHPEGYAIKSTVSISLSEWDLVLEEGDPVLAIHIPATGGLTPEAVSESLNRAIGFFKKYCPQETFKAFYCGTWFIDSQFRYILPESSNIVQFQKRFYLYPILTNDLPMFDWVFSGKPDDLSVLPRKTQLHKAILSHYEQGGRMRLGTGFILITENTASGMTVYQLL